jgi:hypothetical protein
MSIDALGEQLSNLVGTRETQFLPFTVSLVSTASELAEAIALRSSAYARHKAPAAELMKDPEEDDGRDDIVLLIARSKFDGGVVGTMRINPNLVHPMHLESAVTLPEPFASSSCAEFMRLGVTNGPGGRLVTSALAKTSYEICVACGIDYIFVGSRPSVEAVYRGYMFDDLLGKRIELSYAAGVPHRILCLPVREAEERWRRAAGTVYQFFVRTEHPDIRVDYAAIARRLSAPEALERVA